MTNTEAVPLTWTTTTPPGAPFSVSGLPTDGTSVAPGQSEQQLQVGDLVAECGVRADGDADYHEHPHWPRPAHGERQRLKQHESCAQNIVWSERAGLPPPAKHLGEGGKGEHERDQNVDGARVGFADYARESANPV